MATAWIAGASGLVGEAVLRVLLEDPRFERVVSVGRRSLPLSDRKLVQVETDFSRPSALDGQQLPSVAFCCLGTTIAKAGSPDAFRKVDHDLVLAFARAVRNKGARVFLHVSSLGADVESRFLYSRVKGEVERDVAAVGFPSVYALRPSLLDGERKEFRLGERIGLVAGRALGPLLGKYRPTPVEAVARTMVSLAMAPAPGVHVVEPDGMAMLVPGAHGV